MKAVPEARLYNPLWVKIRDAAGEKVRITADPRLHARIIRAVNKEKIKDHAFKFELGEKEKSGRIETSAKNSVLTFWLIFSIGIDDI